MDKLLTVKEAASYLRVSESTVYRLCSCGLFPHIKKSFGIRIKHHDLEEWLGQDKRKAALVDNILRNVLTNLPPLVIDKAKRGKEMARATKSRHNYGYGAVYIRRTKAGNIRFYIDYYGKNRKRIQKLVKSATSWEDALLALQNAIKEEFLQGKVTQEEKRPIYFVELADLYTEDYAKVNKKSWKTDVSYIKGMREHFKDKLINSITPQDVEQYKKKRIKEGVKLTTVNKCLQILSKMINLAISWRYLKHNPVKEVKKYPEEPFRRKRVLSPEEEERLFTAIIPSHLRSMIRIFLNTGLRRKELFQLTWGNVNFESHQIFISDTKTSRSRYIPMNETVYAELKALNPNGIRKGLVFVNPKTVKAFVDIRRAFYGACRRAKIDNLILLDLRRTFATRLLESGVDIISVGQLLGHTSVTTTADIHNDQSNRKEACCIPFGR